MQSNSPTMQHDFELFNQTDGSANTSDPHHRSAFDFSQQVATAPPGHAPQPTEAFVFGNEHTRQNGSMDFVQGTHNASTSWSSDTGFPHNQFQSPHRMPRRSESVMSGSPTPSSSFMQSPPQPTMEYGKTSHGQVYQKYPPYQGLFATSEEAKQRRRVATRFGREAYINPATDPTIAEIQFSRQGHVARIYHAMISGHRARDNMGSISLKRWVEQSSHNYPQECIEACAHRIFDALMYQVNNGFKGWPYCDYVSDERKGDDVDREVDCEGRLTNIIDALEQEKTVCEDVMASQAQIRIFVNAPRAYANRKHQNRLGNQKRKGSTGVADGSRSVKSRKAGRRASRTRTATTIASQSIQQQLQLPLPPTGLPYYQSPATSNPVAIPRSNPGHHSNMISAHTTIDQPTHFSLGQPMLSPQRFHGAQSFNPHMATMPNLHDPFMSPPMVSNNHFSAPNTPEVLRAARSGMDMLSLGSTATSAMDNSSTIDPMLGSWNYGDQPFSPTSIASDFHSEGGFGFDGIDEDVHDTIELSGSYKGN